jgi:hypothetical protein
MLRENIFLNKKRAGAKESKILSGSTMSGS